MNIEDTTRRRGHPRSFDLDEVIAKAALLFWERGYEGVSVDDLTTEMGITTQSFYSAFGSKQKLHAKALDWYAQEVVQPVRAALDGADEVTEAIREALHTGAREFIRRGRPSGCMRSMAGLSASRENQTIARLGSSLRLETTMAIQARLLRGANDGQLAAGADCKALALYINAVVVGMAVAARDGAPMKALQSMADLAVAAIRDGR